MVCAHSGEISSCSDCSKSLSPSGPSADLSNNGMLLYSVQSDENPKIRTIAVALQAHKKLQADALAYTYNHLIEPVNCRVVVISCLSRIQDEMGVDHHLDVEAFRGVNSNVVKKFTDKQMNILNHFLRDFRTKLAEIEVQLDIRIITGPKSESILLHATQALHPHWVVLDRSFASNLQDLKRNLDCNLVLMKKPPKPPEIINLNPSYLGPVEHIDEPLSGERDHRVETDTSNTRWKTPTSSPRLPATNVSNLTKNSNVHSTNAASTTNDKSFTCFNCLCLKLGRTDSYVDDGPGKDVSVLYGDKKPGEQAAYLGKFGPGSMILSPAPANALPILEEPSSTGSSTCFQMTAGSRSRSGSRRSGKIIEARLKATMALPPVENDPNYMVRL